MNFFSNRPKVEKYSIIDSKAKLDNLALQLSFVEEFAFDTETNTLAVVSDSERFSLVGISFSWGAYNNYYIPLAHRRHEDYGRQLPLNLVTSRLKKTFERTDVRIIGAGIKFDLHVLARVGIHVATDDIFDIIVASWLCDENGLHGLKENSVRYLNISQTKFKEVIENVPPEVKKEFGYKSNSKVPFDLVLIDDGAPYAIDDSFYSWELYRGFMYLLEQEDMYKIYNKMYKPFIKVLFNMEERGIDVDVEALEEMRIDIEKDMEDLLFQIKELAGVDFNPSSSQQLAKLLFGHVPKPIHPREAPVKGKQKKWGEMTQKEREDKIKKYEKEKLPQYEKDLIWAEKYSFKFKVLSLTEGGAPQTNALTLFKISKMEYKNSRKRDGVKMCALLCDYAKLDKLHSAFIVGLKEQLYSDGKAHPSFNIIGTDSGRLSCSAPNLQQLPKANEDDKYQIRSLFIGSRYIADKKTGLFKRDLMSTTAGYDSNTEIIKRRKIVALDFSNLEMRILAHFSEDKNLLEMFRSGADSHGSTAVNMFELKCDVADVKKQYPHLRQAAKIINFLLMYGGTAYTLYLSLRDDRYSPIDLGDKAYLDLYNVKSGEEVAQIYIDKYFASYSGVAQFIVDQKRVAKKRGYVQTLMRRKRRLPDMNSPVFRVRAYNERLAVNSSVQGSAADVTSNAQIRVSKDPWYLENHSHMLLQVHDELVFEAPEECVEELIQRTKHYMEFPFGDGVTLNLPLSADADYGNSYADAK